MNALEIDEKTRDAILSGHYDQVRVNLPNGDMVGHTGDIEATIVGCEAVDETVKGDKNSASSTQKNSHSCILDAIEQVGGIYLVTANHGNTEDMMKRNSKTGQPAKDKDGNIQILTSHTLSLVSIAMGVPRHKEGVRFRSYLQQPELATVASTIINLFGLEAPSDYEPNLFEVSNN